MKINEAAIAEALFNKALPRLVKDYGLTEEPATPAALVETLLRELNQPAVEDLHVPQSNSKVYCSAVRALGSGMRSWTRFIAAEPALKSALGNPEHYDPSTAAEIDPAVVVEHVPGISQTNTAKAIIAWARLLNADPAPYYKRLMGLYDYVTTFGNERLGDIADHEVMIVVACLQCHFDGPARVWEGPRLNKWPGMGYALASEFLRNLGWSGFKPDAHIIRLFNAWGGDLVDEQHERAEALVGLTGRKSKELVEAAKYSLAGVAITPEGMSYSKADNLLWLLGSQVVKNDTNIMAKYSVIDFFTGA